MGEHRFAECRQLCRVPKVGHSAKPLFAECRTGWHSAKSSTRQRVALPSATECPALGKGWHSAKSLFAECNTRKKNGTWRLSPPTPSNFFKKNSLPSAGPGTRQRGLHSVKIYSLPSATSWHLAKDHFAECQGRHSAKYFFLFFWPIFCEAFPHYLKLHVQI